MPVITGATGILSRGIRKCLEKIPELHSIDCVPAKRTAILGISHTVRKTEI
jgi:hypothetical protein